MDTHDSTGNSRGAAPSSPAAGTPSNLPADSVRLSLDELAAASDLAPRTVRYYIAEGLLPGPGARGRSASYGQDHLDRLRLIRRLSERHMPLAEQRQLLAGLDAEATRAVLMEEERGTATTLEATRPASPSAYVEALLDRARALRGPGLAERTGVFAASPTAPQSGPNRAAASAARWRDDPSGANNWRRWDLAPGVELHVRGDVERARDKLIKRILAVADDRDGETARPLP
jgi:DNA-binding transcriptional MerR regulator